MRKLSLHLTTLVITSLLHPGLLLAAPAIRQSLAKWSQGQRIEVVLTNGQRSVGNLGAVQLDSFLLNPDTKAGTMRVLRIDEVRSVSAKMTKAKKWGIAAAIYGVFLVMELILGQ